LVALLLSALLVGCAEPDPAEEAGRQLRQELRALEQNEIGHSVPLGDLTDFSWDEMHIAPYGSVSESLDSELVRDYNLRCREQNDGEDWPRCPDPTAVYDSGAHYAYFVANDEILYVIITPGLRSTDRNTGPYFPDSSVEVVDIHNGNKSLRLN
jgi:hypothetical protein